MKPFVFTLQVDTINDERLSCTVRQGDEENQLEYSRLNGAVSLRLENSLGQGISKNWYQLQKILRSALDGKLHLGQRINCVFLEDFFFLKNVHFSQYIRLDQREGRCSIRLSATGFDDTPKLFADGSANHETLQSGFAGFVENREGGREFYACSVPGSSSNLMELRGLIEGLRRLMAEDCIQVHTDSRYVIRGLVQWVHFWRHNNWQTAYGREVCYAPYWQQASALIKNKCIEFKWVKGHAGNEAHDLCHQLAKSVARHSPLDDICSPNTLFKVDAQNDLS
nr:ribonuclease H [uncultured Desulfobulbus sp.]